MSFSQYIYAEEPNEPFPVTFQVTRPELPEPFPVTFQVSRPELPEPFPVTFQVTRPGLLEPFPVTFEVTRPENSGKPNTAYFKVLVEGSGYTATYGDGTYKVSGSEERYLIVNRGESVGERLEDFRKYIEGDPCERTWPRTIDPGITGAPALFTSGPQVTITDGPYFSYSEFFDSLILAKNWNLEHKDGPHPKKLREMVCQ